MLELLGAGNNFLIWLGGIVAGVAVLAHFLRRSVTWADFDDQSRLCGEWFGYGYFHSELGERFYREKISVARSLWKPWALRMKAAPCSTGNPAVYSGPVWRSGDYIYTSTRQGVRHDPCFEIGIIRLSTDHVHDKITGLHLGQSYVTQVHEATAFVWSKTPLDPHASLIAEKPSELESTEFRAICSRYVGMKAEYFELLLSYKSVD